MELITIALIIASCEAIMIGIMLYLSFTKYKDYKMTFKPIIKKNLKNL